MMKLRLNSCGLFFNILLDFNILVRLMRYLCLMNPATLLHALGIEKLHPMQEAALLAARSGTDILLLAPTGSGKTLAFLLPLMNSLQAQKKGLQSLILVPSRELALQIEQVFKQMRSGFKVSCCYGGHAVKTEKQNLLEAPALLVGTPGRIAFHLREGHIAAATCSLLVLDEFDKSLSLGFAEDMAYIIGCLKGLKQRILTSATTLDPVPEYVAFREDAVLLHYLDEKPLTPDIQLKKVTIQDQDRQATLLRLLGKIGDAAALIFCNRREKVEELSDYLIEKDLIHDVFHGGMEQDARERALIKFRNGSIKILIATDLAARGLDITDLENIIHYQLPETKAAFIHRNGRTARMRAQGCVYLLLSPDQTPPADIVSAAIPTGQMAITERASDAMPARNLPPGTSLKLEEEPLDKVYPLPPDSIWKTLYISAGKKDKMSKMDIVGFLLQQAGLHKDDLGRIDIKDHCAYIAVRRSLVPELLPRLKQAKIKNKRVKIEAAL